MKLVVIYGPPAVGKLTVAKTLSTLTRFKVFHNHLTTDLARSIFDHGSEAYNFFCDRLRLDTFEMAAQNNLAGLIFTFCYCHPEDDIFIDRTESIMRKYNGELMLVFLTCQVEELERRVVQESRQEYPKINSVEELRESFDRWSLFAIPHRESLVIDNTNLSPQEVARHITAKYNIPEIDRNIT